MKLNLHILLALCFSSLILIDVASANPLFENSVVSNDIDFIKSTDPTVSSSIMFLGNSSQEMPDKRNDVLMDNNAYVFALEFEDNTHVEVYGHSDFNNANAVKKYVTMLSGPIGKLPFRMRDDLHHVVIHKGNEGAFAEHLAQFFVLYSENMETRVLNRDLEETVFHESVHATLDAQHRDNKAWVDAQAADSKFVTRYGERMPSMEDFAESALFAYTLTSQPERLPADVEDWLVNNIPHRLEYFNAVFKELDTKKTTKHQVEKPRTFIDKLQQLFD